MTKIKSFSVNNGDMYYINHVSDSFTIIDCNLIKDREHEIIKELESEERNKNITRFISTHPDNDHIRGLGILRENKLFNNYYFVDNKIKKDEDDELGSFQEYLCLKESSYAYKLDNKFSRKWINEGDLWRSSSGIYVLWPDVQSNLFREALRDANEYGLDNNISPIIEYSLKDGIKALWFGDLETEFMEKISALITMPKADVVFAPHHGRDTGRIPAKMLKEIQPQVIIVGEAPSKYLNYYQGYNTITQNSAEDITMECGFHIIDFYSSNKNYKVDFMMQLDNRVSKLNKYYLGSMQVEG